MDQRDELTERIIGCAVALHRGVGPAMKESVYHRGLAIEFEATGLPFVSKPRFPVLYRGKILGEFYPDFIVSDQVIVEVKSASAFDRVFEAQVITYLRVTKSERFAGGRTSRSAAQRTAASAPLRLCGDYVRGGGSI